VTTQII